jgi:esterase/lipase superfamily enzyme
VSNTSQRATAAGQSSASLGPGRFGLAMLCAASILLGACTPRGTITLDPTAAASGTLVQVLAATSRGPAEGSEIYSRERAETLRWAEFTISVPPRRDPGTVNFPRGPVPDPTTDFVTVAAEQFTDERGFLAALNASLARLPPGSREVTLFVHGFNTNFAEGLYRHAQMAHDFRSPGASVSYSWPSAASVRAYAFDRESALFGRDGLERTLELLARSNADDIVVSGHSMGALLVMEALRQLAIRGSDRVLAKLQAVVLMSPDLDVDVFRSQMAALAPREVPIYIAISGRDRALRLSGLLRGQPDRLGSLRDPARVTDLPGVIVIDLTDVQGSGDPLNHFAVATSPAMISFISGLDSIGTAMLRDQDRQTNVFEATVNVVTGVTEVVLQPLVQ